MAGPDDHEIAFRNTARFRKVFLHECNILFRKDRLAAIVFDINEKQLSSDMPCNISVPRTSLPAHHGSLRCDYHKERVPQASELF